MTSTTVEQRRDPRYNLRANHAFVEFDDPTRANTHWSGRVVGLSAAGIMIELDAVLEPESGTIRQGVTLQIGNCRIAGSIAVKNFRPLEEARSQIGGLFYPGTEMESSRLMALLAGMEAVDRGDGARP